MEGHVMLGRCSWLLLLLTGVTMYVNAIQGPFKWMSFDHFDEISDRMDMVNAENCQQKPASALRLPRETLAQLPYFNKLLSSVIYPNRTNLLHLHNMALNRAFFYSYIFQKLNYSTDFYQQPGLMYQYFSAVSDITANEYSINGSSVCYDKNGSYPNFYRNLAFNKTLPLFCPHAWRYDDYNEPTNWVREPTNRTVEVVDLGAGPQNNYTVKEYRTNQWYDIWLPDDWNMRELDSVRKFSYEVGIKYSNQTGKFINNDYKGKVFFGPSSPGQREEDWLPVEYTQPYYDCGKSNRWIVSAVSPIVDQIPRYLDWFHLRREQFTAVSVMDIEFVSIDINPCPVGLGNEPPNYFAGTARCKANTICEPHPGWGFHKGGYQCMCKPGFRYPPWQDGPYQGIEIESATEEEYKAGFDCYRVELQYVIPVIRGNSSNRGRLYIEEDIQGRKKRDISHPIQQHHLQRLHVLRTDCAAKYTMAQSKILNQKRRFLRLVELAEVEVQNKSGKKKLIPRSTPALALKTLKAQQEVSKKKVHFQPRYARSAEHVEKLRRSKRATYDDNAYNRMLKIFARKEEVNENNCHRMKPEALHLPGDVSYGADKQLSPQARTALRLSHFLSNFLQNIDMYEEYGNLRGDKLLNVEQIFAEVLANVMGDLKIKGSGVFFDVDKYRLPTGRTRQYFGPYAYRYEKADVGGPSGDRANTHFRAVDYAGFQIGYLDKPWFQHVKERWQSNTFGLQKFTERPLIRSDLNGTSLRKFELYPMFFHAPKEEDGLWSAPYFDCNDYINSWIVTYSVPFFGLNSIGTALEFKGVVTVDVKLEELDLRQCPMEFHVPNAFKDTARCHFESTYCVLLPGWGFRLGGYKCNCLDAYEYPFEDRAWYYDGQTVEEEYRKLISGEENRYHTLKCRISGEGRALPSTLLLLIIMLPVFGNLFL